MINAAYEMPGPRKLWQGEKGEDKFDGRNAILG
jgi:hypothetical protein